MANAIRAKISMQIGLVTGAVDALSSLEDLKETALRTVCIGTHDDEHPPVPVSQYYECKTCKTTGKISDFEKAREVTDNSFVLVPEDEREAMTVPDSLKKNLQIIFYPREQIEDSMLPSGKPIYLRPSDMSAMKPYIAFREAALERDDRIGVAIWAPKGAPAPHRLEIRGDVLILQPLCWPHQVAAVPEIADLELADAERAMLSGFVDGASQDFDPAAFKDIRADALAAYVASQSPLAGEESTEVPTKDAGSGTNFFAALQATVDAGKKAPAKRAAKKPAAKKAAVRKSA